MPALVERSVGYKTRLSSHSSQSVCPALPCCSPVSRFLWLFLSAVLCGIMCSRRANIRPSLLQPNQSDQLLAPAIADESPSPTTDTPQRKRVRNWRRSTGPLAPEDLQLAMLETEKEAASMENRFCDDEKTVPGSKYGRDNVAVISAQTESTMTVEISNEDGRPNEHAQGIRTKSVPTSTNMDYVISQWQIGKLNSFRSYATRPANFEIDYKKLYEFEKYENDCMRERMFKLEALLEAQSCMLKKEYQVPHDDVSLGNENERMLALEMRVKELEEEVKTVETLRADNQRLKEENGALIRVISKLSK